MQFKPVIGLEVHIELATVSKMFCGCSSFHFRVAPNTNVCPICLGLPGALPNPNLQAIYSTIKFGSAFGCKINNFSKFDRKHYFYPDLPKGYQISQYDLPFCTDGMWVNSEGNKFRIRRIHLEEDTGKLIHLKQNGKSFSLIDFNRSGVPLLELVTEPDFTDPIEVTSFLKEVQLIARYLNISSADMEKGSMRLEANISLSELKTQNSTPKTLPDYKVELKNINSFRFLSKALKAEIERQEIELSKGTRLTQETRGYDEKTGKTYLQRSKEEAKDYRYFPEPDIPPINLTDNDIVLITKGIGDLPQHKRKKYKEEYLLPNNFIEILVQDKKRAAYFEKAQSYANQKGIKAMTIADYMVNKGLDRKYVEPVNFVDSIASMKELKFSDESEMLNAIEKVLSQNSKAVDDYRKGKTQVIGFLIGFVQKELKGKGDPQTIRKHIQTLLR